MTFTDVTGTLAGFRMPSYQQGISVAGYHSHFIDRTVQAAWANCGVRCKLRCKSELTLMSTVPRTSR